MADSDTSETGREMSREDSDLFVTPGPQSRQASPSPSIKEESDTESADSDIVEIDGHSVPVDIQEKWMRSQWRSPSPDLEIVEDRIKRESLEPDILDIPHYSGVSGSRNNGTRRLTEGQDEEDEDLLSEFEPEDERDNVSTGSADHDKRRPNKKGKSGGLVKGNHDEIGEEDGDALEDAMDDLRILQINQRRLERKQEKGNLTRSQRARLRKLKDQIQHLQQRLGLHAGGQEDESDSADNADEDSGRDSDDAVGNQGAKHENSAGQRIRHPDRRGSSPKGAKRKMPPVFAKASKKQKSGARRSSKPKRTSGARATEALRKIMQAFGETDPVAAAVRMSELPVHIPINAKTIAEWEKEMKAKYAKDPNADLKRIRGDNALLRSARGQFRKSKCKLEQGLWRIKGMKSPLLNYQLAGAGWMMKRERDADGPNGGILADAMGLGKTVEALALIVGHPPTEEEKSNRCATTLIIAPANAVHQWHKEIYRHCDGLFVLPYHDRNPPEPEEIQNFPIVLTSYHEAVRSYPSDHIIKRLNALSYEEYQVKYEQEFGLLHKIKWRRIILDEAHAIKNTNSQTSKACLALQGKYTWALTGTPVHNHVGEFFPYLQFIRCNFAHDQKDLTRKFGTMDGKEEYRKLHDKILMKRDKSTLFLGERLFELPKPHAMPPIWVTFSKEEELIYRRVEKRFRDDMNSRIRAGTAKKSMQTFLIYVLRLRQAVSHPYLLESMVEDYFDDDDLQWLREQLKKMAGNPSPFLAQIGRLCERKLEGRAIEAYVTHNHGNENRPFGQGSFGRRFNIDPQLEMVQRKRALTRVACDSCSQVAPTDRTGCGHNICRDCGDGLLAKANEDGAESAHCPVCHTVLDLSADAIHAELETRGRNASEAPSGSRADSAAGRKRKSRIREIGPRGKGDDCHSLQPKGDESKAKFLEEADRNVLLGLAPSAKTTVVKDLILEWQRNYPDDKIIVFTQFVVLGRILGRVLQEENINFLYYFGELSHEEKQWALKDFREKDNIKVLVGSLKCCGQALNLDCANRVIILDLWWNHSLEMQAFGRVWRMGQKKETHFARILVKNSIDVRLSDMQMKKLDIVHRMILEFDSVKQTLSEKEAAELLGRVREDKNGGFFVESDYEDEGDDAPDVEDAVEADAAPEMDGAHDND